ncbi:Gfo/Idh/MocA family oxidoreductase [Tateyamaria omphalii]|uniref:Gfo/Idh/MocA family protein n=1 Tax=Tateyamaria omphalii TaxID=299262 RepID=UPI001C99F076|nr:Gfo/Idh/MocA family oxidoreductase [Tateyamaria omphalii]MBY5931738.1 Gfo/Idh/MocA family oxidoreductase [Tateyamaria omphalii]
MIRVACVGAGYFSQFHYGSWARMEGVEVVGACDLDREKAAATGAPAFDDLGAMLTEAAPDLLDVILPPPAHAATIRAALTAGVKWIICQKPFCMDLKEARGIVAEAYAAGARLVVHENFRFQPWYRAIKAELEAGAIGEVLNATFRLRPGDGQGPEAYLDRQPYFQKMPRFLVHETAVHWVDTFAYLFGPAEAVYADLRRINPVIAGEDAGHVIFDHGPVRALFDGNRHLDHVADNLRRTMGEALIEGTRGELSLHGDGSVTRRGFGSDVVETVLGPDTWDGFGGDCVHALQSHVIRAMVDGTALENEARDYLRVIAVKDAIYASADAGRKIVLEEA